MPPSDAERLAVLEEKAVRMERDITRMSSKIDVIHEIMLQAKGARWVLLGAASLAGFLTATAAKMWPLWK